MKRFEPLNIHASIKAEVKGSIPKAFAELKKLVETQINADVAKALPQEDKPQEKPKVINKYKGLAKEVIKNKTPF